MELDDELARANGLLADLGESDATTAPVAQDLDADLDELFNVSRELVMATDLADLLPRILRTALRVSGAERGILFRFDEATGDALPAAWEGCEPGTMTEAEAYSRTVLDEARSRRGVLSQDTSRDPRYQKVNSLALREIRSVLCIPIANDERVLGALYLDNRNSARPFSRHATRVTGVLAGLSAVAIQNVERYDILNRQVRQLSAQLGRYAQFDDIVGRSKAMLEMLKTLDHVANSDFPVLLRGESGSGKEVLCRAIHRASARAAGPLVIQNCAAVPAELLESEFFGHARGAFTGAHADREGLFRRAHGGTLFLDEIAELDIRLQAKLLRVLEDGTVRPIGSEVEHRVDFRLISATSVDMQKAVETGRMRRDLFYRLNVVTVQIPSLRQRPGDIPLLVEYFVRKHAARSLRPELSFSRAALDHMQQLSWPGNVRELEHVVQRALVLVQKSIVEREDLPRLMDADAAAETAPELPLGRMTLAEIETWAIREALARCNGNKARAAQLLGMHRNALLRRLDKMRLAGGNGQ